jgi:hypothetical protein
MPKHGEVEWHLVTHLPDDAPQRKWNGNGVIEVSLLRKEAE